MIDSPTGGQSESTAHARSARHRSVTERHRIESYLVYNAYLYLLLRSLKIDDFCN